MADLEGMALPPLEGRKGGREGSARGRRQRQNPPRARPGGARTGGRTPSKVGVYVLKVKRQNKRWPERHERRRKWPSTRQSCFYQSCGLAIISQKMAKTAPNAGKPKANHNRNKR